jgi:hypothetical protein
MTKQERMAGLIFAMFGLAVGVYSGTALKIGTISQPGPGMFPMICGFGITLTCLIWLFKNRNACNNSTPLWSQRNWCRPLLAIVCMSVYAALMEELGYVISTLLFLVAWQLLIEAEKWKKTAVIALVGTVVMYILFVYLLRVALPEGMFGI